MKAFLCAICILLSLVVLMLCYTFHIVSQIDRFSEEISALPRADTEECLSAVAVCEAHWLRMRRLVSLSVNIRTVEQIDHLVTSLRVTAQEDAANDFEIQRGLLSEALRELRHLSLCDLWGIV